MSKPKPDAPTPPPDALFDRIVGILEEARARVLRTVNHAMVTAYWLIGREIVEAVQGGAERAKYGQEVIEDLSARLTERYGKGFSVTNLWYFRQFYLAYADRAPIPHPPGGESQDAPKLHPPGGESTGLQTRHQPGGVVASGFSPHLSWSHYRALMRVKDAAARNFYEREAAECGWSKAQLERQIQSSYYQRIFANRGKPGLTPRDRERLPGKPLNPGDLLKSPYVLEFLGLPDAPSLTLRACRSQATLVPTIIRRIPLIRALLPATSSGS